MNKIKIGLLDDHIFYRGSLKLLLDVNPIYRSLQLPEDGLSGVQVVEDHKPDVIRAYMIHPIRRQLGLCYSSTFLKGGSLCRRSE